MYMIFAGLVDYGGHDSAVVQSRDDVTLSNLNLP